MRMQSWTAQDGDEYVFRIRRTGDCSYLRQKGQAALRGDRPHRAYRPCTVDPDLFSSVVHHIIGQQISTKAQATIWQRMQDALGDGQRGSHSDSRRSELQALGMTFRKAEYITDFAERVHTGCFELDAVAHMVMKTRFGLEQSEGHRRLDGGDDFAVLPAAA